MLDLRDRRWISRQKVEGPKKISEVHQDAMRQQQQQEQRDRDDRGGRGGGGGRRMDGPSRGGGGGGGQHFNENRMMSRDEIPTRTVSMQRQQSSELSLRPGNSGGSFARPGGGLGAGSGRPGGAGQQQTLPPPPSRSSPARNAVQQQPPAAAVEPLSEEKLKQKGLCFLMLSQRINFVL